MGLYQIRLYFGRYRYFFDRCFESRVAGFRVEQKATIIMKVLGWR